jgi:murein DD-endopeptidase MepM/ murein hydrolase activator NlpD
VDEQLLWHNAVAFLDECKPDLAASLASQLCSAKDTDIAKSARELLHDLSSKGIKVRKLRSPWFLKVGLAIGQLTLGAIVPVGALILVAIGSGVSNFSGANSWPTHVPIAASVNITSTSRPNSTITKTLPEPVDENIILPKDSSVAGEIAKLGVTLDRASALAIALEPVFPSTMLKVGQTFTVTLEHQLDFYGQDAIVPVRLAFSPGPNEEIVVEADEDGRFIARVDGAQQGTRSHYAESPYYRARAKVGAGLYSTAKDNGVPDYIVTQMMQVFAYDVDFQHQVKADDLFEIFYGNPLTGSSTKPKVVHYTSLTVDGETKSFFRFTTPDGETSYYDENGRSADRGLSLTGVGFAVPYGTPLMAAGDGVITVAGWQDAYGKVVRIRHQNNYETVYAHMSRIPTTIKPGVPVRQGQVIGFVGSTGPGPHADFEIRIDGKPVDPLKVKATGGRQLTGKNLAAFGQHMQKIIAMMKAAPTAVKSEARINQESVADHPSD